jgi:hypothetical protein
MTDSANEFSQEVSNELIVHLIEADFSICGYNLNDGRVSIKVSDSDCLEDLSRLVPTLRLWVEQRGAELDEFSTATLHSDGCIQLSFRITPKTGLPAVKQTVDF